MLLLSGQLAVSIDVSPLTKIHQSRGIGPPVSVSPSAAGHGTNTSKDLHGNSLLQCRVQAACHGPWGSAPQLSRSASGSAVVTWLGQC